MVLYLHRIYIYFFSTAVLLSCRTTYRPNITDDGPICAQVRDQDETARGCGSKNQAKVQGATGTEDETQ
jgi:hypothetical protein